METVKVKAHIGSDGILKIKLPHGIRNVDADVEVSFLQVEKVDKEDWTTFVNRTYGILKDDPIERPRELPEDVREPFE